MIFVLLLWPGVSLACEIPVFSYALQNWAPAPYEVYVFHSQPLSAAEQRAVDRLRNSSFVSGGQSNIRLNLIDLKVQPHMRSFYQDRLGAKPGRESRVVVFYPDRKLAWAGPLTPVNVERLVTSPSRAEIAAGIMGGDTAVWLLLDQGLEGLQSRLDAVAAELNKLEKLNDIRFSIVRVDRADPDEAIFIELLQNNRPAGSPMAFPVFGRGRVLPALSDAEPDKLKAIGDYITGDCSCEIKEQNPGYDLLMSADWIAYAATLPDPEQDEVPELARIVEFSMAPGQPEEQPAEAAEHIFLRGITAVGGLLAAALILATVVIIGRRS